MYNEEDWKKAVAFHGHECPGLAIGFRACDAAVWKLGIGSADDEELVCVTENDACGCDAVQALLSCTFGKGNLIYRPRGKQAFSFFDRTNKRAIRICLKPDKRQMSRSQRQTYLLDASIDELFSFSEPKFEIPERARIFKSRECELCGESASEQMMRLQDAKSVCLDCFRDYSRGWE